MIPSRDNNTAQASITATKEKVGAFEIFSIENFVRRLIGNWYWFILFIMCMIDIMCREFTLLTYL